MDLELRPKNLTKAHLKHSSIGEDYWSCDFSDFLGPDLAKNDTKKYLRHFAEMKDQGIGLLYAGPSGTGKTTLAVITLKYILVAGWTCYMTSLSELIEEIQRGWDGSFHNDIIDRCRDCNFLLLDDLGKEHIGPSGFSATVFDNLIRHRIQHRNPTFITTNLSRKDIKARYGKALLSLVEGKMYVIEVNSSDVRQTVLKPDMEQRFATRKSQ